MSKRVVKIKSELKRNPGCDLDLSWLNSVHINLTAINQSVDNLLKSRNLPSENRVAWLLKAITLIDLTTLSGDDTPSNVARLCHKAANPLPEDILNELEFNNGTIRTAAVCVYPSRVADAVEALRKLKLTDKIHVASVATGFPSGQTPLSARLQEIEYAVDKGANEIDIVIDRCLVLTGKWDTLYSEIKEMRQACGEKAHMKVILATGELGTFNNVYKASLVAMMAGADFIKTSTGKEALNATLQFGVVMSRAIKEYYGRFGCKVGLKPAGGIRTGQDAIDWLVMVKKELGNDWLDASLFRFGASGLLDDIEEELTRYVTLLSANYIK